MTTKDFFSLDLPRSTPGQIVRAFRENFRLTQEDLSKITGIASTNISAIENDKVEIGRKRAVLLAAAFGISPSQLMFPDGYDSSFKAEIAQVKRVSKRILKKKAV